MRVADHFEEVIGLRVAALEARVAAEAESVKEHFAELQSFITFSLTRQTAELRTEFKREIGRLELRIDRVEQRLDRLDEKADARHEAIKLVLSDILDRLPAKHG